MIERKRYPSDLTDELWALIKPGITAWKAAHRSVRQVVPLAAGPAPVEDRVDDFPHLIFALVTA